MLVLHDFLGRQELVLVEGLVHVLEELRFAEDGRKEGVLREVEYLDIFDLFIPHLVARRVMESLDVVFEELGDGEQVLHLLDGEIGRKLILLEDFVKDALP
jgi:hypothetical protein